MPGYTRKNESGASVNQTVRERKAARNLPREMGKGVRTGGKTSPSILGRLVLRPQGHAGWYAPVQEVRVQEDVLL